MLSSQNISYSASNKLATYAHFSPQFPTIISLPVMNLSFFTKIAFAARKAIKDGDPPQIRTRAPCACFW
jgi:hypothetical protein